MWTFALAPARPNPFTGVTVLKFTLPAAGRVDLRAYDLRGREVACLAFGAHAAGGHAVTFRAIDSQGRALAPGTYFAHLHAETTGGGAFDRTVRMTLLR